MDRSQAEIRSLPLTKISIQTVIGVEPDRQLRLTFHTVQLDREVCYTALFDNPTAALILEFVEPRTIEVGGITNEEEVFSATRLYILGQWHHLL